jgi:hypothetical protein
MALQLGLILGVAQIAGGMIGQGKAKKLDKQSEDIHRGIPNADPGVMAHLNEIRLQRRFAESGNSRQMAFQRRGLLNSQSQSDANLLRASGGAPGTAIDAILRNKIGTQEAMVGAGAAEAQRGMHLLGMEGPIVQDMSDRAMSLQTYLRDKKHLKAQTDRQSSNNMISSGVNSFVGGLGGLGTGAAKSDALSKTIQGMNPKKYENIGLGETDPYRVSMYPEGYSLKGVRRMSQPMTF